jgi:hypothetical protein
MSKIVVGKPGRKSPLRKHKGIYEDNIKTEVRCKAVLATKIAVGGVTWQSIVNTTINILVE